MNRFFANPTAVLNVIAAAGILALHPSFTAPGLASQGAAGAVYDDLQWIGYADEHGASLMYGLPESGMVQIAFSCTPSSDRVGFAFEHEPIAAIDGVEVTVYLQAGDIEIPIETTGMRLEMDDIFLLEGTTVPNDRLLDLLTSRETLFVYVEDGSVEFPLDHAAEAATDLIDTCRAFASGS